MSYRTYSLEKELSEVKAKLEKIIEIFASVVHNLDDDFKLDEYCTLPEDVLKTFNGYWEEQQYIQAAKDHEYDRWCEWDEGQMSDEEYYHGQPEDRDYPDEKTGED